MGYDVLIYKTSVISISTKQFLEYSGIIQPTRFSIRNDYANFYD